MTVFWLFLAFLCGTLFGILLIVLLIGSRID